MSSEQLQPIGLLFPERPSECEEQDHSTTNFVKSVLQAGPSGIPDTEALSSGEPKPIISNVARGPKAREQHWKLLAEGHHLINTL